MNIVIVGAGAIGSLFGALLSKHNTVLLIGRKSHADKIRSTGLQINGKTMFHGKIPTGYTVEDIHFDPDVLILSVKSFDTLDAIKKVQSYISKNTVILTFQNGLDNIENIQSVVPRDQILAGITTHGSVFIEPGVICHTGIGRTTIGELDGSMTNRLRVIVDMFCTAGIPTHVSSDINGDIWQKAIINSSINPLTAIFRCKNGHLLKNPLLTHLVKCICEESTHVANSVGYDFKGEEMLEHTIQVIAETKENYSSMFQSVDRKSRTEIDSINGIIVTYGKKNNVNVQLNEMVQLIIKQLYV
jgi:2-dehydropantoate 2-reductase